MSDIPTEPQSSFGGEIRVASKIIDYLSSGLYNSPASCLKELVNNSYDAGATKVEIFVKPDADRVIVSDNGIGMSKNDFVKHFARVSESHKRDDSDETDNGRPKIGKIGIGLIAANELCDVMEIYSTKSGSEELLHVYINFHEMRQPAELRQRNETDYAKADYHGEILFSQLDDHYTQIFLLDMRIEVQEIWAGIAPQDDKSKARSLYGLKKESIVKQLSDPSLSTWKNFDGYSETMLKVALNVPVGYYNGWMPDDLHDAVKGFEKETSELNFRVYYDGTELGKPIVFAPHQKATLIERFDFDGEHISAHGYFYAQHGTIKPTELQGILLRIRHAAVGEYDHSWLEFSPSESGLIQRWVSAEIWADDRLEAAMNIDRRTLRVTHPAYVELRHAIHKQFRVLLKRTTAELYKAASEERKQERASATVKEVGDYADQVLADSYPVVAHDLKIISKRADIEPEIQKALQRKYSVTELYKAIISASEGFLTSEQLDQLLKRITERLEN